MEEQEIDTVMGQDGDAIHLDASYGELMISVWKKGGHASAWIGHEQALQLLENLKQAIAKQEKQLEKA